MEKANSNPDKIVYMIQFSIKLNRTRTTKLLETPGSHVLETLEN